MVQQAGSPGIRAGDTASVVSDAAQLSRATLVGSDDGRTFPFGPRQLRILVDAQTAEGGFAIFESTPTPAGSGPPLHRHHAYTEAFYVLAGEIEFEVDGDTLRATAGSLVHVPGGAAHTFANPGPDAARMLVIVSPARALALVEEHGTLLAGGPPDPEQVRALYARHQSEIIDRT